MKLSCDILFSTVLFFHDQSKKTDFNSAFYHYRPQRSWGEVIFSQASVILSTGGGACSGGRLLGGSALGDACSGGGLLLWGGAWSRGVCSGGGVPGLGVPGLGVCSSGGDAWSRGVCSGGCLVGGVCC